MNKIPKGRNDNHKTDYSIITDKIIVGSNFCKGMRCKEHAEEFSGLGISVEINLDDEKKEIPPDEIDSYTWLPVVDGYPPTKNQLDIGTSIINQSVINNLNVYVHCRNGHGRSPTLVAAYLIRYQGMNPDDAIKLIKEKRPEIHIEKSQMEALEKFAKL